MVRTVLSEVCESTVRCREGLLKFTGGRVLEIDVVL
jgi:hypothetical protein